MSYYYYVPNYAYLPYYYPQCVESYETLQSMALIELNNKIEQKIEYQIIPQTLLQNS